MSTAMDHSLLAASHTTHLKIVVVALLGAILVVTVGIAAHLSDAPARSAGIVKAGQPIAVTARPGALSR
jgi:hypothetical protein